MLSLLKHERLDARACRNLMLSLSKHEGGGRAEAMPRSGCA
jgi:hypothetical protein